MWSCFAANQNALNELSIILRSKCSSKANPIKKIPQVNLSYVGLDHSDWFKFLAQPIRMLKIEHSINLCWNVLYRIRS